MLEKFLEKSFVLERFRSSPVGPHIDGFAEALIELGYAWQTGASCLRHAVHIGRWSAGQGIAIKALDEDAIEVFEAHLPSCECPYERAAVTSVPEPGCACSWSTFATSAWRRQPPSARRSTPSRWSSSASG